MQTPERTKELDDFLNQPIDELLWDLDLLPEQCDSRWKNLVRETIERLAARNAEWQARAEKLEAALSEARLTVGGIFTANYKDWDEGLNTPEEYILWSKSRSGDLLRKLDAALGREA